MAKVPYPLPKLIVRESPNQSQRVHGPGAIRLIAVHTPEGAYKPMVNYCLRSSGRRVSYHGLLREDGEEFTQLVPWNRKAWHIGPYNSLSIGISAAGYARNFNVESKQAQTLARITAFLLKQYGLPARWSRDGGGEGFMRHADVQTDRSDPMSLDKWRTFVRMVQREYRRGHFRKSWGRKW